MVRNQSSRERSNFTRPTLYRSLFKGFTHYQCAEKMICNILQGKEPSVPLGGDGKVLIEDVLDFITEENPSLDYVGEDHLVELYLRHSPSLFFMEEDSLVSLRPKDYGKEVEPPEILYFGTVRGVSDRVMEQGLQSQKRDFTVMTESEEAAVKRALQFGKKLNDEPVVLEIFSKEAYGEGTEFLVGGRKGLYMASRISKKYINPEVILAPPQVP